MQTSPAIHPGLSSHSEYTLVQARALHRLLVGGAIGLLGWGLAAASTNALELPFAAADVAVDHTRGFVYATDYAGQRLVAVNLTDGSVLAPFVFTNAPESIAITPNGQRMYVALLTRPHSDYWFDDEGHVGYIAEFDLAVRAKTREFQINEDPYDLAATDGGILVVPSGSGQWTYIRSYRTATGALLGTAGIRQMSRIALHPSQRFVYTADTDLSPSDIEKFGVDPVTGALTALGESPYHGDYPMGGNVFCHPNGTNLIVRGGGVFTSSEVQAEDMRYVRSLAGGLVEAVAFDLPRRAFFTVAGDKLWYYNSDTLEVVANWTVTNGARYVGIWETNVLVASVADNTTLLQLLPNPAIGAESNLPPAALFTRLPADATTRTTIAFDASGSTDDLDPSAQLQYRWDWEDDGAFDTGFTNQTIIMHRYNLAGTKTVALQVKDRFGAVSTAKQTFNVALELDPGEPGGGNLAFEVPFAAADVAFDPVRPVAYVTGYSNQALVVVSLTNGFIERQFSFDWNAESIAVTPNGQWMYVALLRRPHSPYWFGGHTNFIAEFDLAARVKIKEFQVAEDPFDLVATDGGLVAFSGGSDQSTYLSAYWTSNGVQAGTVWGIYDGSRLSLHPSQRFIYAADNGLIPSDIERYGLDPLTGAVTALGDSPYHGDYPMSGNVFCHPNGTNLIVRGGGVFTSSEVRAEDMRYVRSLAGGRVDDVAFALDRNVLVTVFADGQITAYRSSDYGEIYTDETSDELRFAGRSGNSIFVVAVRGNSTVFLRRPIPAATPDENTPPVVNLPAVPPVVVPGSLVSFLAAAADPDGVVTNLSVYDGGQLLTQNAADSVLVILPDIAPGAHLLTVVARDNFGASGSNAVLILASPMLRVTLDSPSDGAHLFACEDILLAASVSGSEGQIARVLFYESTTLLGVDLTAPFTLVWPAVGPGDYALAAVAIDDRGIAATSCVAQITVTDTTPPTITCPDAIVVEFMSETGAVVRFEAAALDSCSEPVVELTPPSGSLFPIGRTTVLARATDAAGNHASCQFTVTVVGPRVVKERILGELQAWLALTEDGGTSPHHHWCHGRKHDCWGGYSRNWWHKHDRDHLEAAIRHLENSLKSAYWVDQTHLERKRGDRVFEEERAAVGELCRLIGDRWDDIPDEALLDLIDRLFKVDRTLAAIVIDDALRSGTNPKKLVSAQWELAQGDRDRASQRRCDDGINHYENAWQAAVRARIGHTICRLPNGHVRLDIEGDRWTAYTIQAGSNLRDWTTIGTRRTDGAGKAQLQDADAVGKTLRFYRVLEP